MMHMNTNLRHMAKILLTLFSTTCITSGCAGMTEQQRNTAMGASVGAAAGAIATNGRLIGTAAGAIVGAVIGNEIRDQ